MIYHLKPTNHYSAVDCNLVNKVMTIVHIAEQIIFSSMQQYVSSTGDDATAAIIVLVVPQWLA